MNNLCGFVERLSDYMIKNNITTRKMAALAGCSKTCVAAWLKYNIFPKVINLTKLADFFNSSIDYLLGFTENKIYIPAKQGTTFFQRFKLLLSKNGLTIYGLSKKVDISQPCMSRWQNGRIPTIEYVIILCDYFSCSIDYILGRSDIV